MVEGPRTATVPIESIGSDGSGVGRLEDGRVVFVQRTAPGDVAEIRLVRDGGRWARGKLLRVREPGADRRSAPCPHYDRCGGCTLEHLDYRAQLAAKGTIVAEALRRIGRISALPEVELHGSPSEWRYRNRVTFTLRRSPGRGERPGTEPGSPVTAGFHALEAPGTIVDVDERCLLPEGPIAEAWGRLRASWGPGASALPSGEELRLTLRSNRRGEVLLLIGGGKGRGDPEGLLEAAPPLAAIWKESPDGSGEPRFLAGSSELEEEWYGERVALFPAAFLQGNREAAALLHEAVQSEIGEARGRRVLDAYCGFGLYGAAAARQGAASTGIESDAGALRMSEALVATAPGFRILAGAVEDRIEEALPADVVVLNPPRQGVDARVTEALARSRPERVVYVSCDPATLARDVARLGSGFRATRLQLFDLFPQTAHVEAVLTLVRDG